MQAQKGGCPLSITGIGQNSGDEEQPGLGRSMFCKNPSRLQHELADILDGTIHNQ